VVKQTFADPALRAHGPSQGDHLAQPHERRAAGERASHLLESVPVQQYPGDHLAQQDHLGDRGCGGQQPESHGQEQSALHACRT
jgi:hypothetical protein